MPAVIRRRGGVRGGFAVVTAVIVTTAWLPLVDAATAGHASILVAGVLTSAFTTGTTEGRVEEQALTALLAAMGNKRQYHPLHRGAVVKWPPTEVELHECEVLPTEALVVVARHGQRFPSKSKLAKYIRPLIAESLSGKEASFAAWANDAQADVCFSDSNAELLHPVGAEELKQLGRELAAWVIEVAEAGGAASGEAEVRLASSPKQRCRDSCTSLADGLRQDAEHHGVKVTFQHSTEESVALQQYKHCPLYQERQAAYGEPGKSFLRHWLNDRHTEQHLPLPHSAVSSDSDSGSDASDSTNKANNLTMKQRLYFACQAHYSCYGAEASVSYLPCRLSAGPFGELVEDFSNYFKRGPASRLEDSDNVAMWLGVPLLRRLESALTSGGSHIWCTHDTVLFPLLTLLDLFQLGSVPERSNASRLMPMASRLVIRRVAGGRVCAHYNGRLVATAMGNSEWWGHAGTWMDRCASDEL